MAQEAGRQILRKPRHVFRKGNWFLHQTYNIFDFLKTGRGCRCSTHMAVCTHLTTPGLFRRVHPVYRDAGEAFGGADRQRSFHMGDIRRGGKLAGEEFLKIIPIMRHDF